VVQFNRIKVRSNPTDNGSEEEVVIPGLRDISNEDSTKKQVGKIMGMVFKQANELDIEGYRIERQTDGGLNEAKNWVEVKRYTFSRLNPA
jgi:hypothetical protein